MLLNTLIYTIDVEKGFNNNTKNGEKNISAVFCDKY